MYFLYKLPNLVAALYLRSTGTDTSALHVLSVLHSIRIKVRCPFAILETESLVAVLPICSSSPKHWTSTGARTSLSPFAPTAMQKTTWRARELKCFCLQQMCEIMYGTIGVHVVGRIVDWNRNCHRSRGRSKGCIFSKTRTSRD